MMPILPTAPSGAPRASTWTRRGVLRAAGAGALAATALPLAGCAASGSKGRTTIRWMANKPEVLDVFDKIAADFNASQDEVYVRHDGTQTSIVPQFVRGAPPDVATYNYNLETANYIRGGVLSDLGDLPEAKTVSPKYQSLVEQYATYKRETSVLPWSVTAAGVIYNPQLFADNGVEVPTTWGELTAACETFAAAGLTPIYATGKDTWTLRQGQWDYCTGSGIDVPEFFSKLKAEGADVGKGSSPTFASAMGTAAERMVGLRKWFNPGYSGRIYSDGNLAMSKGEVAMYFQGPWALAEIAKTAPDLKLGTFGLPMTDDPRDVKARVNLDLAVWIAKDSPNQEAAMKFVKHLMSPEICNTYNQANLAFSPLEGSEVQRDPRTAGLAPLLAADRIYQGAGTFIPDTIPIGNYLQGAYLDGSSSELLSTLDADWQRLATRSAA